jgi:hypothetical protein
MWTRCGKAWIAAIGVLGVVCQPALDCRAAQKQADLLWYKTVEVKRVAKANRRLAKPLPKTETLPLLTLQLRLFEHLQAGRPREVDSKTVFRTGDQLKVRITPNQDGYLYFILPSSQGGELRNDRIFVRRNTQYVAPSVCPGPRKAGGCFFTLTAPAPASGIEEMVIIFSRNQITNLPSNARDRVSLIKPQVLAEIKARSGQSVSETAGGVGRLLRGDSGRFAMLFQNTNREDNEELVVTLKVNHQE